MDIWKFKAHLNRLFKKPGEMTRFCALSMREQDAEINAYWEK